MRLWVVLGGLASMVWALSPSGFGAETAGDRPPLERGTVSFQPTSAAPAIPERYRLAAHSFPYTLERQRELANSEVAVDQLCFPSPVVSDCPANNTVYAEYYRPRGTGPFPGVIVLDITAGNQQLSRTIA